MKGIAKIKGSLNPKIGEDSFYEVVEFHKGTPMPNPNAIKWKLFKKNNGKWEEAKGNSKTGKRVSFNFSPRSYGKEILVEAYLYDPEMKSPPGLVVKPVLGPRKILNTEILDANGGKITQTPKYGQSITLKVTTQNMPGEILKLSLWERDTFKDSGHDASSNTKLWSGQSKTIDIKGIVEQKIQLTLAMQKEANKGVLDGSEHEFYLLVEAAGMKTISATTQVSNQEVQATVPAKKTAEKPKEAKPIAKQETVKIKKAVAPDEKKPDDSNKPVKVGEDKKVEKGNCPNCDKDITLEEIKKICVSKPNKKGEEKCLIDDVTVITAALPSLNEYRKKVGINTCIRKAHFLAQISQETKFYDMQEGFKYTNPERMRGLFYSYFKQFGDKDKQLVEAKRLSDLSLDKKNHPEVANAIYGNKHPMGKNHTDANDGWRYSGKGFKQITWKDNYVALQKYVKETYKIDVEWVGGDNPYKLKNNGKDAILSALAFWGKNGINGVATEISDNSVESVTALINPAKAGIDERKRFFKKAIEVLKVKKCQKEGNVTVNEEKGTVVVVSGKGSKMISNWVVYETNVYFNITLSTFKKLQNENKIPKPDYTTYLSRDAHGDKAKYGKHSDKRYGRANETPPGEYYLIPAVAGQSYKVYLSSDGKSASITGPDGNRDGVAIHQYSPKYAIGCLTTVSGKDTSIVDGFLNILEDLPLRDNRPVRIIIEERKVKEETWSDSSIGTKKWTGIL